MNLDVFLSLFSLMLISLAVYVLSKKMRIPYTVLLVIAGSGLVPLSQMEFFSFISSFELTPELLFFVFLPILIFESAYNMNIRSVTDNFYSIGLLAVVGMIVSTVFIGVVGHYVFKMAGFEVPMLVLLLFGAIISSTDPVAVLSLFKDYGAPKRLTLIFEGESLFNDATGFAAFLAVLDLLIKGFHGYESVVTALTSFTMMLLGGIVFGLIMGFLFAKLIEWVKGYEHLEITLTLLVAHITFTLAELISEHLVILGQEIRLSSIIATLIASMVIGNFGRYKMSPHVEEYMERFWSYFAFLTNSIVFILMGLLFAHLSISINVAILPIFLAILVVLVGRAVSVYPILGLLNLSDKEEPIPLNWMHLLSWGSLRGSLAVIMVLLIPDNLTIEGWTFDFTVKQFVSALTIGSIYFTLLVKATTIGKVMRRLGIDALTDEETVSYFKSKAIIYHEILNKLKELMQNDHLTKNQYYILEQQYLALHQEACMRCKEKLGDSSLLIENLLRTYLLGLEMGKLKEMFYRDDIPEKIYKKIFNMLSIQADRVATGKQQVESVSEKFPTDGFEQFISFFRKVFFTRPYTIKPEEMYLYLWSLNKITRFALEELNSLSVNNFGEVFDDKAVLEKLNKLYEDILKDTQKRMDKEVAKHAFLLDHLNEEAAAKSLRNVKSDVLQKLHKDEIITSKLYIMLNHELNKNDL